MRMPKNYDGGGRSGSTNHGTRPVYDPMVPSAPVPTKKLRKMFHYGGGPGVNHYKGDSK